MVNIARSSKTGQADHWSDQNFLFTTERFKIRVSCNLIWYYANTVQPTNCCRRVSARVLGLITWAGQVCRWSEPARDAQACFGLRLARKVASPRCLHTKGFCVLATVFHWVIFNSKYYCCSFTTFCTYIKHILHRIVHVLPENMSGLVLRVVLEANLRTQLAVDSVIQFYHLLIFCIHDTATMTRL